MAVVFEAVEDNIDSVAKGRTVRVQVLPHLLVLRLTLVALLPTVVRQLQRVVCLPFVVVNASFHDYTVKLKCQTLNSHVQKATKATARKNQRPGPASFSLIGHRNNIAM